MSEYVQYVHTYVCVDGVCVFPGDLQHAGGGR